jgi:glycosyltransferase involved in cell wall biosynthesis
MTRRITFLNNQGLISTGGGVTILRHLVRDLMRDLAVTVLSFDQPAPGFDAIRQVTLPAPPPPGRLWRLAPLLRARHLRQVVSRADLESDVTVVLDCHFGPLLKRIPPRRLIYLSLSCIPRQEWFGTGGLQGVMNFPLYISLERSLIRHADHTLVSSRMHADELRRFEAPSASRLLVLHPIFPTETPPRRATDVPKILSAGRLESVKNHAAIIAIAERLCDLPCQFVIAGDGPLASVLRRQAEHLSGKIAFRGDVADLRTEYAEASLYLHPSRYESFGISVFEAMRAGIPPIVSRNAPAGYREILQDGISACFVDFNQPDTAATAIRRLLLDNTEREAMGAAARAAATRASQQDYTATFRSRIHALLQTAS